ncbi:hypothetical protein [Viridibacillus arvi]|uniref:hypothetical protein n=1 Tax=Viridibacillus arvi TaxID=263475 RepID=UPI0036EE46BA
MKLIWNDGNTVEIIQSIYLAEHQHKLSFVAKGNGNCFVRDNGGAPIHGMRLLDEGGNARISMPIQLETVGTIDINFESNQDLIIGEV